MYKKLLKNLKATNALKKQAIQDLYKSASNPIIDRRPHFMFSAENPIYPENKKYTLNHNEVVDLLKRKGYKVEEIGGHYGKPERSILVHNPSNTAVRHLLDLSKDLGQESSIYSDGYNHEMHYHGGNNAGQHVKGQGTEIHKRKPDDFYSVMPDGTTFTHRFNLDKLYKPSESAVNRVDFPIKKSEDYNRLVLAKQENDHALVSAGPDTKLIHFSPNANLPSIDPFYQGERITDTGSRRGKPVHPMSFFYLENSTPEDIVVSGSKSKYISRLGDKKLYDLGTDPENIRQSLRDSGKTINPGIVSKEEMDSELKNRGYHGVYNSAHEREEMRNVIGMYYPMKVEKEYQVHPKDFKQVTSIDHHGNESGLEDARRYAKENGHHDGTFLHKLASKFSGE